MLQDFSPRGVKLAADLMVSLKDPKNFNQFLPWKKFPNITDFTIEPSVETEQILSTSAANYGAAIESYTLSKATTCKLTVNQIEDALSLSAFLLGTTAESIGEAGTESKEITMLSVLEYVETGDVDIENVTLTRPAHFAHGNLLFYRKTGAPTVSFVDPEAAGAAINVTVVGDAITVSLATNTSSVVTSTESQVYDAFLASDPASALLGVVKLATTNNVVTPAEKNLTPSAILTQDVDFTVLSAFGMVTKKEGGGVLENVPHTITYQKRDSSGILIRGNTLTRVSGKMKLTGINLVTNRRWALSAPQVTFAPDGELALIGGDPFATASWTVTMEVPPGETAPYTLRII